MRSLVGLIPLFAVERLEEKWIEPFKEFRAQLRLVPEEPPRPGRGRRPHRRARRRGHAHPDDPEPGSTRADHASALCDPAEFLSDYGIRSLSKAHEAQPFVFDGRSVGYEPAEAVAQAQGGQLELARADLVPDRLPADRVAPQAGHGVRRRASRCRPRGSDRPADPVPRDGPIDRRAADPDLHPRPATGRRAVFGDAPKFQDDPHWRDLILFYEYFHGDNGAGLGASHQTGWTALVASLIDEWREH